MPRAIVSLPLGGGIFLGGGAHYFVCFPRFMEVNLDLLATNTLQLTAIWHLRFLPETG